MPRIVVTPTPDDERRYQQNDTINLQKEIESRNTFMMLSQKLRSMTESTDDDDFYSENNRFSRHDINIHRRLTPITECSSSSSNCNISSLETDTSDDESDLESDEKEMKLPGRTQSLKRFNSSLQVADSFTNVKTDNSSNKSDSSDDDEDSEDSEDEEEIQSELGKNNSELRNCNGKEHSENPHRQCNGLLGVIIEEEEKSHQKLKKSFNSTSSTSDSSATAKDDYSKQNGKTTKVESGKLTVPIQTKCKGPTPVESETEYEYVTETEYETEYEEVTEEETEVEEELTDKKENDKRTTAQNVTQGKVLIKQADVVVETETEYETEYEEETEEETELEEESTDKEQSDKRNISQNVTKGQVISKKANVVVETETEYETEYDEVTETELEEESSDKKETDKRSIVQNKINVSKEKVFIKQADVVDEDSDEEEEEDDEDNEGAEQAKKEVVIKHKNEIIEKEDEETDSESSDEDEDEDEEDDIEDNKNAANIQDPILKAEQFVSVSLNIKDNPKNKNEDNKCLELPSNRKDYIRNDKNYIQPSVSENDVSVSFSIPSRSSSTEHNSWHSKASSLDVSSSRPSIEYEDSDSEVSVNVFLPKRDLKKDASKQIVKPIDDVENKNSKTVTTSDAASITNPRNLLKNTTENMKSSTDSNKTESDEKSDEPIICVREKIAIFESPVPFKKPEKTITNNSKVYRPIKSYLAPVAEVKTITKKSSLEESELEDDSGVTSDVSRPDTDTESECFVELRKLTRYQRAATHSRLFKLLQGEDFAENDEKQGCDLTEQQERKRVPYKPKKIVHNVSITRKTNPNAINEMETHAQRRQRLSLNFNHSSSIDNDNISTSPSSPVNENLVKELVQSILKKEGKSLQNVPHSKLHAAAKRVLQEDLDSLDNTCSSSSFESTPVLTPQEFKSDYTNSYSDYYDSWDNDNRETYDILPSKAFKTLREQSLCGRKRQLWAARCPRVLSSKSVNRDLGQVIENREPSSPDPYIPYTTPANRMSEVFKITNDE